MTAELNDEQCEFLLGKDLDIAIADAVSVIGEEIFNSLSDERQDVLVDMSFNLGKNRFSKFKDMIGAVQDGNFDSAADEILDSKAARDPKTKTRYENLAQEMRGKLLKEAAAASPLSAYSDADLIEELYQRLMKGV